MDQNLLNLCLIEVNEIIIDSNYEIDEDDALARVALRYDLDLNETESLVSEYDKQFEIVDN